MQGLTCLKATQEPRTSNIAVVVPVNVSTVNFTDAAENGNILTEASIMVNSTFFDLNVTVDVVKVLNKNGNLQVLFNITRTISSVTFENTDIATSKQLRDIAQGIRKLTYNGTELNASIIYHVGNNGTETIILTTHRICEVFEVIGGTCCDEGHTCNDTTLSCVESPTADISTTETTNTNETPTPTTKPTTITEAAIPTTETTTTTETPTTTTETPTTTETLTPTSETTATTETPTSTTETPTPTSGTTTTTETPATTTETTTTTETPTPTSETTTTTETPTLTTETTTTTETPTSTTETSTTTETPAPTSETTTTTETPTPTTETPTLTSEATTTTETSTHTSETTNTTETPTLTTETTTSITETPIPVTVTTPTEHFLPWGHNSITEHVYLYLQEPLLIAPAQRINAIHLHRNGYVMLNNDLVVLNPLPFNAYNSTINIVAPLLVNYETTGKGNVSYSIYGIYDLAEKIRLDRISDTEITETLNIMTYASNLVTKHVQGISHFTAVWVLVVTWYQVTPSAGKGEASFQLAIVTDYESTYYFENVKSCAFSGTFNAYSGRRILTAVEQKVQTGSSSICSISTQKGNSGYLGFNIYDISSTSATSYGYTEKDCFIWFLDELSNRDKYLEIVENGKACHCDEYKENKSTKVKSLSSIASCYYNDRAYNDGGMECCYTEGGALDYSFEHGGSYLPLLLIDSNLFMKYRIAKRQCCVNNSKLCPLYFHVLPPKEECLTRSGFTDAFVFGDPHISTLDGYIYTFNGLGEYWLLRETSKTPTVGIQTRTERALTAKGTQVNATIFTAFAGKDINGGSFEVQLNVDGSRDKLFLFANGDEYTTQFYGSTNFSQEVGGTVRLKRINDTVQINLIKSGLILTTGPEVSMLSIEITAPDTLKGKLTGLLGNYDGDQSNDLILPNGTVLRNRNYSESEIFYDFGQKWMVNTQNGESYFTYERNRTASYYSHPEFVPLFLDSMTQQQRDAAEAACGGSSATLACIYDFFSTGSNAIAKATQTIDIKSREQRLRLENASPSLTGPSTFVVEVGKLTTLYYNGSDDGTFTYRLENVPSSNFSFDANTGLFSWTPTSTNPEKFSVVVVDNLKAVSRRIDLEIKICSVCSQRGSCGNTVRSGETDPLFKRLVCQCHIGWTGSDCETEFDGCSLNGCSLGRICTDLTPTEEQSLGRSYNCSACPTGYSTEGVRCIDINECSNSTLNNCEQDCTNTVGGYTCSCRTGYRKDSNKCSDISECDEKTDQCEQECTNTLGAFTCSCFYGYKLKADNKTCNRELDLCTINSLNCSYACSNATGGNFSCVCPNGYTLGNDGSSCKVLDIYSINNLNCSYTCSNATGGNFSCVCPNGYTLGNNGSSCKDVDECRLGICTQGCTNTVGSYSCSCLSGFKLTHDKTTCEACSDLTWGVNCANECVCSTDGTTRCDAATGCVCKPEFKGTDCSEDVNECTENPGICQANSDCLNLRGSYRCICRSGFTLFNGQCVDDNECTLQTHNCSTTISECENVNGGFNCRCKVGFAQKNLYKCEDVDECTAGSHDCAYECKNMVGSFYCKCPLGFLLDDDRRTCTRIPDESPCQGVNSKACGFGCIILGGRPTCICQRGYTLGQDGINCLEVNECLDPTLNKCSQNDTCVNTDGGFTCSCSIGFKLENDGRTCTVCDSEHFGTECTSLCNCGDGADRCDPVSGCVCKAGWVGDKCDIDVNECNTPTICSGDNEECFNTPGSYKCRCKTGYTITNGTCLNINECATKICSQRCTDTDGSYTCSCEQGFRVVDKTNCEDINQCKTGQSGCQHDCENYPGLFKCTCRAGYRLGEDLKLCIPKTQCSSNNNCSQTCQRNSTGYDICSCNVGYTLNPDGKSCDNINECQTGTPCSEQCLDKTPGYECECQDGKRLDVDKTTCIGCDEGTFGANCSSNCTCVASRTQSCNRTSGVCSCKPGYNGTNCEGSINECSNGEANCPANSHCVELDELFRCTCNAGYIQTNDEKCTKCSNQKYGDNCQQSCTCDFSKTGSCNHVNGSCECKTGWTGANCTEDVNECSSSPCTGFAESCQNNDGSYRCVCVAGYEQLPNGTCVDANECQRNTDNCHSNADCHNAIGNFSCTCKMGFVGDGLTCNDINECQNNTDICHENANCTNTQGSFTCTCKAGYTGDGQTCIYITTTTERIFTTESTTTTTETATTPTETAITPTETATTPTETATTSTKTATTSTETATTPTESTFDDTTSIEDTTYTSTITSLNVTEDCVEGKYGNNCSYNCSCIYTYNNTMSCNKVNGSCTCSTGWTGNNCENDINECTSNTHNCTNLQNCTNTNGSYSCPCLYGFTESNGECLQKPTTYSPDKLDNPGSADYQEVYNATLKMLTEEFKDVTGFVKVIILILREGSLNVTFQVVTKNSNQAATSLSNTLLDIAANKVLFKYNDTITTVLLVQIFDENGVTRTISASMGPCAVLVLTQPCSADYVCREKNGKATCLYDETDDGFALILGLGVGIPLFLLALLVVIVLCVYTKKYKRLNKSQDLDRTREETGLFPSVIAPKFNSWSRPPYYSPGGWGVEREPSDISSTDGDPKSERKIHSRSQYHDNLDTGGYYMYDNGATSNFSWDFMYKYFNPREEYKIKRPSTKPEPDPAYSVKM